MTRTHRDARPKVPSTSSTRVRHGVGIRGVQDISIAGSDYLYDQQPSRDAAICFPVIIGRVLRPLR